MVPKNETFITMTNNFIIKLREKLMKATKQNLADGLFLSGGLDTTILASLAPGLKAFTISLESYGDDSKYAEVVAKQFNMEHYQIVVDIDHALSAIPEVIRILQTFDPTIPNDLAIYFALKFAKDRGAESIMTGDGADELLAGYSYMFNLNLNDYIPRIAGKMHFSSNELGRYFGIEIKQPYLDKEFIEFSLKVPWDLKVKAEYGKLWGKWILRKTFEDGLSYEVIWQDKRSIEYGSGFTKLRDIIESNISNEEFKEKKRDYGVRFINKEHLFYFEVYRSVIGDIPPPMGREKRCPGCGAGMDQDALHCRVCGNNIYLEKERA